MKHLLVFSMVLFSAMTVFATAKISAPAPWQCVAEGYDSNNFPIPVYGYGATKDEARSDAFRRCGMQGYRGCRPAGCSQK